jgi:signal transduction histidine kinase
MVHLEEFSYTVSHDLRAPARAMKRYAEIALQEGRQLDPEIRGYLERIIRGGARMERLVEDVLTYRRLARRELTMKPVQVEKVVRDIIDQYPEMQAPRANVGIAAPMQPVQAHEATLAQGVSNLLLNAVKFVREGEAPEVVIRTSSEAPGSEFGWRTRELEYLHNI